MHNFINIGFLKKIPKQWYVVLGLIILVITLTSTPQTNTEESSIRTVHTKTLTLQDSEDFREFAGVAQAEKKISISFRVPGLIVEFPIKVGDYIKKDQLIAQLDDRDYKAKLYNATTMVNKAQASYNNAKNQYQRIKKLVATDSASGSDLDNATSTLKYSIAELKRARNELQLAERELTYTTIKFSSSHTNKTYQACRVNKKLVETYENIQYGQSIANIECYNNLEIEVDIPEDYITNLHIGDKVTVVFNARNEKYYQGEISEISVSAKIGSVFLITVKLNETQEEVLKPGMSATVHFTSSTKNTKNIIVPRHAVSSDTQGQFVYKFTQNTNEKSQQGIARKQYITINHYNADGFVIEQGLNAGDTIITTGIRYLYDGRVVTTNQDY